MTCMAHPISLTIFYQLFTTLSHNALLSIPQTQEAGSRALELLFHYLESGMFSLIFTCFFFFFFFMELKMIFYYRFLFFKNTFKCCCSSTGFCLFSPLLPPTPTILTSLPRFHPALVLSVSFVVVPANPSPFPPHYPLPSPLLFLSDCS